MAEDSTLRKTKQRKRLFDILRSKPEPMTADELLSICQLECPNMALTTVYRNLDRMIDLGYATKLESTQGAARYAVAQKDTRIVLICRVCQERREIRDISSEAMEELIEERTGYDIEHRYLEFFGICPKCQARSMIK